MARPKGSKNKKTLLAEAITHGLSDFLEEEIPKVIKATIESAKDGDVAARQLIFANFVVPQTKLLQERLARETKVVAQLPGGGRAETLSDSREGEQLGFNVTFSVVGSEEEETKTIEGEVIE